MADTWDDSSSSTGGSYGPRGPITRSDQRSGYTPPDNYSGYRGGISDRDNAIMRTEAAKRAAGLARAQEAARQQAVIAAMAQRAQIQQKQNEAFRAEQERQAQREALLRNSVAKMIGIESGGDPFAKSKLSSAEGLLQFTKGTWMDTLGKYRPDLLEGKSKEQILSLRTDPNLSFEMGVNLARENANFLEARGLPVNEGSLYMSHFLGAGDASKVLQADPNTPISNIVQERSINANKSILGGDKTAADINRWASNIIGKASPFDTANLPAAGAAEAGYSSRATELYGPNVAYEGDYGNAKFKPYTGSPYAKADSYGFRTNLETFDNKPTDVLNELLTPTTSDDLIAFNEMRGLYNRMSSRPYDPGGFSIPTPDEGTEPSVSGSTPAAAPVKPAGLLDMLFGGPEALQKRISGLEAEGRTSTYPTFGANNPDADWTSSDVKQWYADEFAGGDVSKVKSRIVDFGEGPVVDYYVKDLGDVAGEAISGLLGGIGNLFGGSRDKAVRGPNEAYGGSAIAPGSIFGNLFRTSANYNPAAYGASGFSQPTGGGISPQLAAAALAGGQLSAEDLSRNPALWREYYNRLPANYGMQMAQAPLMAAPVRGIFS